MMDIPEQFEPSGLKAYTGYENRERHAVRKIMESPLDLKSYRGLVNEPVTDRTLVRWVRDEYVAPLWTRVVSGELDAEEGLREIQEGLKAVRSVRLRDSRDIFDKRAYREFSLLTELVTEIAQHDVATDDFHRWLVAEASAGKSKVIGTPYRLAIFSCVSQLFRSGRCSDEVFLFAALDCSDPHILQMIANSPLAPHAAHAAIGLRR